MKNALNKYSTHESIFLFKKKTKIYFVFFFLTLTSSNIITIFTTAAIIVTTIKPSHSVICNHLIFSLTTIIFIRIHKHYLFQLLRHDFVKLFFFFFKYLLRHKKKKNEVKKMKVHSTSNQKF